MPIPNVGLLVKSYQFFNIHLGIPQGQRNITMHIKLAARKSLQWWCQWSADTFILSTKNFKMQKISPDLH